MRGISDKTADSELLLMDPWCICLMFVATAWMDSHPGGKEILLLAAGRDITYAFDSYHPFTEKPEQGTVLPVRPHARHQ